MGPEQQPTNTQNYTTPSSNPEQLTPVEPPKNKKSGLVAAIVVILVVLVGVVIFAMMNSDKKNNSTSNSTNDSSNSSPSNNDSSTINSDKFQKYDVTDKTTGLTFSIAFYKDAKVEEKKGRTFLNSGGTGSMHSVYLGTVTGDKIDCSGSPSLTMKLGGESTTVCYLSDKTHYIGYIKTKSGLAELNLAGQQAISTEDATAILESATFN